MKTEIYNARKSRLGVFQLFGSGFNQLISKLLLAKKLKIIAIIIFAVSQFSFATAPVVVSTAPVHNATNVNVTDLITITFDQPIQAGIPGKKLIIWYYSPSGSTIYKTHYIDDFTISGNTIALARTLPYDTEFFISFEFAFAKNASDEYNSAFSGSNNWFFTTESDTYAPILTGMNPPDNSVGIYENSNILRYSFNEDVQAGSGNIIVRRVDNDAVALNADVTNPSDVILTARSLTIVSTSTTFDYSTEYYVEFPSGVIEDLVGNPFAGIGAPPLADHDFTMRANPDVTGPLVSSFSPADEAINVSTSTDLVINFNEAVQIGSGTVFVKNSSGVTVQSINIATASISGSTATIPLTSNLGSLTGYYIMIGSGVFQDLAGNNYAGISSSFTWNFTTINADVTPPSANTFTPIDNATGVSLSNNLTLIFSEPIQLTGSAVLKNSAGTTIPSASSVSGSTLTINPTANLINNTQYYVELANGVIKDLAGNSYAGFSGNSTWNFTTVIGDITPPAAVTFTPLDNATGVSISNDLTLTFNENITITGNPVLRLVSNGNIFSSFNTVSGNTLTINPFSDLPINTQFYVEIANGVIKDIAGNSYAGFSGTTAWNFTTVSPDVTAPTAATYTPARNTGGASLTNDFTVVFSENIQIITSPVVRLSSTNAIVPSTSSVSGNTLSINPSSALLTTTFYYVQMPTGSIQDIAGNDFIGFTSAFSWRFQTEAGDITAPVPVTYTPTDNATGVSISNNLTLTFDETIQLTGGAVLKNIAGTIIPSASSVSGSVLTINPTANLINSTQYYVELANGVIKDVAGNSYTGFGGSSFWNFTTIVSSDVTPPTVSTLSPADNATGVASTNWIYTVNFDEDIQIGSGLIGLKRSSDDAVLTNAVIGTVRALISGSQLTIDFNADGGLGSFEMTNSADYYIVIPAGTVEDLAGNAFAGIAKPDWSFTTEAAADVTDPSLVSLNPTNGTVGRSLTTNNLFMIFDENMQAGAGNVYVKRADNNAIAITKAGASLTNLGATTIYFSAGGNVLDYGTEYYVEVEATALTDLSSNPFGGIVKGEWHFTTEAAPDVTAPTIASLSPADDATNVSLSADLVLTADESIVRPLSGSIIIKSGTTTIKTIPYNDASVDFTGSVMTVTGALSTLNNSTAYWVNVAGIKDLAGNVLPQTDAVTWNFTTEAPADVTPPSTVTYAPLDNATGVSISNNLTLSFNETIQLGTGSAVLKNSAGTTIPSSSSVSGSVLTINPTSNLANSTQYYVEIANGVVQDVAGNDYAGFSGSTAWNFTTEAVPDNTSPLVSAKSPLDDATNVLLNEVLTLTFDEDIMIAIGGNTKQVIIRRSNGSDFEVVPLTAANIVGNTLTIPHAAFEYNQGYYIYMLNGVIADLSNNYFGGMVGNYIWNFTTEAAPILTVTADNKTITYGDAIPSLSSTITGYVNGDDATAISTEPTISTTATNISDAGIYDITLNGGVANNYSFSLINGILTINKANQTVAIDAIADKVISDTAFPVTANATSLLTTFTYAILSGPASISASGVVTLGGTTGTVVVEVAQAGDINYNAASATIAFNVSDPALTDQTITFDILANKNYGDAVILSASSSSFLAVSYSVVSGPATVPVSGNTVTLTGLGTVVIEANQTGDASFNPATPVQQSFNVTKAALMVTADNKTIVYGDAIPALTYTYSGFVYSEDATALTTEPSISTVATNSSNVGSYDILLSGGVADNYTLTLVNGSLTINKIDQVISIIAIADKLTTDLTVNVVASTTSSLALTYSVTGPATITGTTISLDGTEGLVTVTVSQAGDANFNAATAQTTFNVAAPKTDQVISITTIADKLTTDLLVEVVASTTSSLDLTYSVTGPATILGTIITLDGTEGLVTVTVSQAGDANFNAATAEVTFNVTAPVKADQTITITTITDKLTTDAAFDVVATTTSSLALTYSVTGPATITGTTISLDGTEGLVTVTVSQAGNASFNAATAEVIFNVAVPAKADQTITITTIADKLTTDAAFDVIASTTSNLDLTYSVTGPATIAGTIITLDGTEGAVTVTVSQAGDASFNAATADATFNVSVPAKADQVITFNTIEDQLLEAGSVMLSATSDAGLEITYEITSGNATVLGNVVTFTDLGIITVNASQSGDDSFNAATSVEQTFEVVTVTSVAFETKNPIQVSPNPAANYIQISEAYKAIRIVSTNGVVVYQSEDGRSQIDISNLNAGSYIIMISTKTGTQTIKLLKK